MSTVAGIPIGALGKRFDDALRFAVHVHCGDTRKGSEIPYVAHLLGVCSMVLEEGCGQDQAIAALLHDAAEDHGGEAMLEKIRASFGPRVAEIVAACSDTLETKKPPWRQRKERYLEHLEQASDAALLVCLADKLYNARAITRDYRLEGERLWKRFKAQRDEQLWYYRSLSKTFLRRLPACRMTDELGAVLDELEALVATAGQRE
jgi:(p)ppGpp synthase/HD superfamily hydrolase